MENGPMAKEDKTQRSDRGHTNRYTNIKYDKERWVNNGLLCKCKICTQHCHLNTINCRRVESVENL